MTWRKGQKIINYCLTDPKITNETIPNKLFYMADDEFNRVVDMDITEIKELWVKRATAESGLHDVLQKMGQMEK